MFKTGQKVKIIMDPNASYTSKAGVRDWIRRYGEIHTIDRMGPNRATIRVAEFNFSAIFDYSWLEPVNEVIRLK